MSFLRPRHLVAAPLLALLGLPVLLASPASAVDVGTAGEFVAAFEDDTVTEITLTADLTLPPEPTRPLGAPPLTIEGNGFTLTGAAGSRVLSAFNPTGALTVRDITITGGTPDGGQGAGIAWGGPVTVEDSAITGNDAYLSGGGVYAVGSATIDGSVISGNSASDLGAGVYVQNTNDQALGTATIVDSQITGQTDTFSGDGVAAAVHAGGAVTVLRSTIADNQGTAVISELGPLDVDASTISGNGGDGVTSGGEATVVNSTVHGNAGLGVATDGFALVQHATITGNATGLYAGDEAGIFASIIGESVEESCLFGDGAVVVSLGANRVDDMSCGPTDPSDVHEVGLALGLGALADNGGPTLTRLPAAASTAVDAVPTVQCESIAIDQRGTTRPQGEGCDAGAVERSSADATPVPTPTPTPTPAPAARPVAAAPTFTG